MSISKYHKNTIDILLLWGYRCGDKEKQRISRKEVSAVTDMGYKIDYRLYYKKNDSFRRGSV
jgi:hypothetical protein